MGGEDGERRFTKTVYTITQLQKLPIIRFHLTIVTLWAPLQFGLDVRGLPMWRRYHN
jgi:hypothetical protein